MSPTERLKAVEARLKAQGVVDVKLALDRGVVSMPRTEVERSVVLVLEKYLDGDFAPLSFSDKHLVEQQNATRRLTH